MRSVDTADCTSAGGHWDPANKEQGRYHCSTNSPDECFRGDLSGKLNTIQIGDLEHHISTAASFQDSTLTAADLTAHSLVIHAAHLGIEPVACADILPTADNRRSPPVGVEPSPDLDMGLTREEPPDLTPAAIESDNGSPGPWQWPAPCKLQGEEAGESFSLMCQADFPGLSSEQLCGQRNVTARSAAEVFADERQQRYRATSLRLDMAGNLGCRGEKGHDAADSCYCESQSNCENFPPLMDRTLQQDERSTFAYFDSTSLQCKQWEVNTHIGPGCAPFSSLSSCYTTCEAYLGPERGRDGATREELPRSFFIRKFTSNHPPVACDS